MLLFVRRAVLLAALAPAMAHAQPADPHAHHHAATRAQPDAMPGMDHDAMPGMDHGSMAGMAMSGGSMMAMKPVPQGIVRRTSGPAEAALQAFSDALEVGNRELAIARLAPDLQVVENGTTEDYAAYVSGHLAADIDHQKTVRSILLARTVSGPRRGPQTITSKIRLLSNRSDRHVDILVDETATLVQTRDGWRIRRLEWSSAPAPSVEAQH